MRITSLYSCINPLINPRIIVIGNALILHAFTEIFADDSEMHNFVEKFILNLIHIACPEQPTQMFVLI